MRLRPEQRRLYIAGFEGLWLRRMEKGKGEMEKEGRKESERKWKKGNEGLSVKTPSANTFLVTALISLKMTCKFLYRRPNI